MLVNERVGQAIYGDLVRRCSSEAGNDTIPLCFRYELEWLARADNGNCFGSGPARLGYYNLRTKTRRSRRIIGPPCRRAKRAGIDIVGGIVVLAAGWRPSFWCCRETIVIESMWPNEFSADAGGLLRWPVK